MPFVWTYKFIFVFILLLAVCEPKIDLVFVVDACSENDRFTKANFRRVKNFLIGLIGDFVVSSKKVRISLVLFAQYPKLVLRFSTKKAFVFRIIRNMKLVCGARYSGAALKYAYRQILQRTTRKPVVVMMTTGGSRDDVRGPTALINRKRVETFAIGVGRRYSFRELQYIATDPRHVYTAAFRNLGSTVKLLKRKICKSGMHNWLNYDSRCVSNFSTNCGVSSFSKTSSSFFFSVLFLLVFFFLFGFKFLFWNCFLK